MDPVSPLSPIRMSRGFEREFPGASRSAAEVAANLIRVAADFEIQVEQRLREIAGLSTSAQQTLAILEGAGEPLAGHVIAERLLVRSASMTSLLDTLEGRGLVERHPHPSDRRKVLIHLTDQGREIVDQTLPALHAIFTAAIRDLGESDRERLITSLTTLRTRLHELAAQPSPTSKGRRKRRTPALTRTRTAAE
jgi:DNA-binding MarR family transcriptional regulator